MSLPTLSLSDPPSESPITEGVVWIQGAALGSTATIVAVIAVATIGMLMLSGRLESRRGITVVLGCFILFGATGITATLTGLAGADSTPPPALRSVATSIPSHLTSPPPIAYDPYAGASVPDRR